MSKSHVPPFAGSKTGVAISQRLYSLDALRGLDMLLIIGLDRFFKRLTDGIPGPVMEAFADQFRHVRWDGFHLYDLIFPLFLFIAGVAAPYSISSRLRKGSSRQDVLRHIVRRGLILVLLGIIYNNGLKVQPISEIRFGSVLGRIGLGYMFANIIYLYARRWAQLAWFSIILIGYWLILKFNAAPGFPMGDLTMEGNFASYMDRLIMPGRLYSNNIHDPEGLFSTIPAVATGLLGIFTGDFLKNSTFSPASKAGWMSVAGVVLIILAYIWNIDFPINKNLWTSSFVLCAGGWSLISLALFYYIIDVKGYRKWSFFLRVVGMNSILIYMSKRFINWGYTNNAMFQWLGQIVGEPFNDAVMVATLLFVQWLFLYYCYRNKIFLKV